PDGSRRRRVANVLLESGGDYRDRVDLLERQAFARERSVDITETAVTTGLEHERGVDLEHVWDSERRARPSCRPRLQRVPLEHDVGTAGPDGGGHGVAVERVGH